MLEAPLPAAIERVELALVPNVSLGMNVRTSGSKYVFMVNPVGTGGSVRRYEPEVRNENKRRLDKEFHSLYQNKYKIS